MNTQAERYDLLNMTNPLDLIFATMRDTSIGSATGAFGCTRCMSYLWGAERAGFLSLSPAGRDRLRQIIPSSLWRTQKYRDRHLYPCLGMTPSENPNDAILEHPYLPHLLLTMFVIEASACSAQKTGRSPLSPKLAPFLHPDATQMRL